MNIRERTPPDNQGLDISAKRSINLMIVAFAQQLYIHFYDAGIAHQIKEATDKSVGAIKYGTRQECAELLEMSFRMRPAAWKKHPISPTCCSVGPS